MKTAKMIVNWSLEAECPYCGEDVDLDDQNDDGCFTTPIFNNEWDEVKGVEATCPKCEKDFTISEAEC